MLINTPLAAIGTILVAAVLAGAAPFLFEYGSRRWQGGVIDFVLNPYIIGGMATYVIVMLLFTYAFKSGGTVRVLYPIYASTFIWAAVIAWLLQGDPIRPIHLAGMVLLMTGIVCMSW